MLLKRIPAQQIQIIKIQQAVAIFGSEAKVFRTWHRCCEKYPAIFFLQEH